MTKIGTVASSLQARLDKLRESVTAEGWTPKCGACNETGLVILQRDGVDVAAACLCIEGQKRPVTIRTVADMATADELRELFPNGVPTDKISWASRVEAVGVGRADARHSFETFERIATGKVRKHALAIARLWIDTALSKRSDLVLFGAHGTGKTGIAVSIVRALVERRESVRFVDLDALMKILRGTFQRRERSFYETDAAESERDVLDELTSVDVLVIDEVTGTKLTDYVDDQMRAIVTTRQKAERPTILTLNVDASLETDAAKLETALVQMLGPALFDRFMDRAQMIAMFGESLRGRR